MCFVFVKKQSLLALPYLIIFFWACSQGSDFGAGRGFGRGMGGRMGVGRGFGDSLCLFYTFFE